MYSPSFFPLWCAPLFVIPFISSHSYTRCYTVYVTLGSVYAMLYGVVARKLEFYFFFSISFHSSLCQNIGMFMHRAYNSVNPVLSLCLNAKQETSNHRFHLLYRITFTHNNCVCFGVSVCFIIHWKNKFFDSFAIV